LPALRRGEDNEEMVGSFERTTEKSKRGSMKRSVKRSMNGSPERRGDNEKRLGLAFNVWMARG
jgi:hypothetical protein